MASKLGQDCEYLLVSGLDGIGWLVNLRGRDGLWCADFHSYAILNVQAKSIDLFSDSNHFSPEIKSYLEENQVTIKPLHGIRPALKMLSE